MARLDEPVELLNPLERAACYYTLPRVVAPVSAQFVVVYGFMLASLMFALVVASVYDVQPLGRILLVSVVLAAFAGIIVVMSRSLLNEVRRCRHV